jgi:hypothetical protein
LGSVQRASPYLQTPEPTQDRTYKPNTSSAEELKQTLENSTHIRPCTYGHAYFKGQSPGNQSTIKIETNMEKTNSKTRNYYKINDRT